MAATAFAFQALSPCFVANIRISEIGFSRSPVQGQRSRRPAVAKHGHLVASGRSGKNSSCAGMVRTTYRCQNVPQRTGPGSCSGAPCIGRDGEHPVSKSAKAYVVASVQTPRQATQACPRDELSLVHVEYGCEEL